MRHEQQGLAMSVWGFSGLCAGQIALYLIVIGLTYADSAYAGLWTTTGAGALCIILALVAWPRLPQPLPKEENPPSTVAEWLGMPFLAIRVLFRGARSYPDAFKFLIAYTIYGDALSAFNTISAQLFNLTLRPSLREYTAYTLSGAVVSVISAIFVLAAYVPLRRRCSMELRHWIIASFFVVIFCTAWCCIGISSKAKIGLKRRWEFYIIRLLTLGANSIVTVVFPVSFARMFPRGSEIKYFGIQLAISLATAWVPAMISAPIINATNEIRLPAAIYTFCLLVATCLMVWTNEERGREMIRSRGEEPADM